MKVWYLAHPIAADEHYSVQENLAHVVKVQKLLFETGIRTVAPYYSYIIAYGGDQDFQYYDAMLEMDCECVSKLGRIMLVGHKLSRGMTRERNMADREGLSIVDLINVPDDQLIQAYKERYLEIPLPF